MHVAARGWAGGRGGAAVHVMVRLSSGIQDYKLNEALARTAVHVLKGRPGINNYTRQVPCITKFA